MQHIHVPCTAELSLSSPTSEDETQERRVFRRYSVFSHALIRELLVQHGEGSARVEFLKKLNAIGASECPLSSPKKVCDGLQVIYDPHDLVFCLMRE